MRAFSHFLWSALGAAFGCGCFVIAYQNLHPSPSIPAENLRTMLVVGLVYGVISLVTYGRYQTTLRLNLLIGLGTSALVAMLVLATLSPEMPDLTSRIVLRLAIYFGILGVSMGVGAYLAARLQL